MFTRPTAITSPQSRQSTATATASVCAVGRPVCGLCGSYSENHPGSFVLGAGPSDRRLAALEDNL